MSLFGFREKMIADYLTDPENMLALAAFARTDDGKKLVANFMRHPEGREFLRSLLPVLFEFLDVPAGTKETVIGAIPPG